MKKNRKQLRKNYGQRDTGIKRDIRKKHIMYRERLREKKERESER